MKKHTSILIYARANTEYSYILPEEHNTNNR